MQQAARSLSVCRNKRTACHNPELRAVTLNWRSIEPAFSLRLCGGNPRPRAPGTGRLVASDRLPFSGAASTRLRHIPAPVRGCGTNAPSRSRCFRSVASIRQFAYCGTPTLVGVVFPERRYRDPNWETGAPANPSDAYRARISERQHYPHPPRSVSFLGCH